MYMWVRTVTAGETNCRYQKTVTREQGKITVNGNPTSTVFVMGMEKVSRWEWMSLTRLSKVHRSKEE